MKTKFFTPAVCLLVAMIIRLWIPGFAQETNQIFLPIISNAQSQVQPSPTATGVPTDKCDIPSDRWERIGDQGCGFRLRENMTQKVNLPLGWEAHLSDQTKVSGPQSELRLTWPTSLWKVVEMASPVEVLQDDPTPTSSPTNTSTATETAVPTQTSIPTNTPVPTNTATQTPSPTVTQIMSPTETSIAATATPSATVTRAPICPELSTEVWQKIADCGFTINEQKTQKIMMPSGWRLDVPSGSVSGPVEVQVVVWPATLWRVEQFADPIVVLEDVSTSTTTPVSSSTPTNTATPTSTNTGITLTPSVTPFNTATITNTATLTPTETMTPTPVVCPLPSNRWTRLDNCGFALNEGESQFIIFAVGWLMNTPNGDIVGNDEEMKVVAPISLWRVSADAVSVIEILSDCHPLICSLIPSTPTPTTVSNISADYPHTVTVSSLFTVTVYSNLDFEFYSRDVQLMSYDGCVRNDIIEYISVSCTSGVKAFGMKVNEYVSTEFPITIESYDSDGVWIRNLTFWIRVIPQ